MPFNFSIEGDWDESAKPYDKKTGAVSQTPKPLKLDDSAPAGQPALEVHRVPVEGPYATSEPEDDVRIKQLEAVTQEIYRKIKAIEAKLGFSKDD